MLRGSGALPRHSGELFQLAPPRWVAKPGRESSSGVDTSMYSPFPTAGSASRRGAATPVELGNTDNPDPHREIGVFAGFFSAYARIGENTTKRFGFLWILLTAASLHSTSLN
jgi:hypothetical protein